MYSSSEQIGLRRNDIVSRVHDIHKVGTDSVDRYELGAMADRCINQHNAHNSNLPYYVCNYNGRKPERNERYLEKYDRSKSE